MLSLHRFSYIKKYTKFSTLQVYEEKRPDFYNLLLFKLTGCDQLKHLNALPCSHGDIFIGNSVTNAYVFCPVKPAKALRLLRHRAHIRTCPLCNLQLLNGHLLRPGIRAAACGNLQGLILAPTRMVKLIRFLAFAATPAFYCCCRTGTDKKRNTCPRCYTLLNPFEIFLYGE